MPRMSNQNMTIDHDGFWPTVSIKLSSVIYKGKHPIVSGGTYHLLQRGTTGVNIPLVNLISNSDGC